MVDGASKDESVSGERSRLLGGEPLDTERTVHMRPEIPAAARRGADSVPPPGPQRSGPPRLIRGGREALGIAADVDAERTVQMQVEIPAAGRRGLDSTPPPPRPPEEEETRRENLAARNLHEEPTRAYVAPVATRRPPEVIASPKEGTPSRNRRGARGAPIPAEAPSSRAYRQSLRAYFIVGVATGLIFGCAATLATIELVPTNFWLGLRDALSSLGK